MTINWNQFEEVGGGTMTDRTWPAKDNELKVGDCVEGRYVEKKDKIGKKKNSTMYVLEVGTEKVGVWGGTVLDTKFSKIAVGKMVAIEYLGRKESQLGNEYKDFKVGFGIVVVGDENN